MRCFFTDVFELPLPDGHRFPMVKYRRLREAVCTSPELTAARLEIPPAATDQQLALAHCPDYINRVVRGTLTSDEVRRIGFPWSTGMVERSRRSVGATIAAVSAALEDGLAANLAGGTHHASRERGQGYCVFNDAAVAIREHQSRRSIGRAIVIDCDVHQGNGTAAVFAEDASVFTLSLHMERGFPLRKEQSDLDVPLATGTNDDQYLAALRSALDSAWATGPFDIAVYLAGADPYRGDTLGDLSLSKHGLLNRDRFVIDECRNRGVPVAIAMAGGYARDVQDIVDVHTQTLAYAVRRRAFEISTVHE